MDSTHISKTTERFCSRSAAQKRQQPAHGLRGLRQRTRLSDRVHTLCGELWRLMIVSTGFPLEGKEKEMELPKKGSKEGGAEPSEKPAKKKVGEHVSVAVAGVSAAQMAHNAYIELMGLLACKLEEAFRSDVVDFEDCEKDGTWRDWIEAQAWIVWSYRGSPEHQEEERQRDDYMHAQRYFAFLIADHVLAAIREGQCPLEVLTEAKVRYLEKLSVHQYLQFSAYFRYKTREAANTPSLDKTSQEQEQEDYAKAAQMVEESLRKCVHRIPTRSSCLTALRSLQSQTSREMDASRLTEVKLGQLRRLRVSHDIGARVRRYVEVFYEAAGVPKSQDAAALLETIGKTPAVPTMFELMVICFIFHCAGDHPFATAPQPSDRSRAPLLVFCCDG